MPTARTAFAALVLTATVASGCDMLDSERLGWEGGMVVSEDGRMALEIPEGTLDEAVEITIEVNPSMAATPRPRPWWPTGSRAGPTSATSSWTTRTRRSRPA